MEIPKPRLYDMAASTSADDSMPGSPASTDTALSSASHPQLDRLMIPSDEPSSDSSADEDHPLYADQDDAQSIFQPALSPAATRLTSPKTPAAEKAAAMDKLSGGGLFDMVDVSADAAGSREDAAAAALVRRKLVKSPGPRDGGLSLRQVPPTIRFPSPWQSGPKDLVIQDGSGAKPALSGVFASSKHRRSASGGTETFRRLRGALPNITLPTGFFSSLTSPSFFSASSSQKSPPLAEGDGRSRSPGDRQNKDKLPLKLAPPEAAPQRAASAEVKRPRAIRRSTSDESMLYNSLSRVSSLGDDERWGNVREQTNVRIKAIRESIDRPTFKLPQLPSALKRNTFLSSDSTSPTRSSAMPSPVWAHDGPGSEFDRALEMLTGDIVIMGGYRGSILRSRKTNRQVWVPVKVGLNIRKVNLAVGLNPEDEENMEDTIYPSGMLQNIGPVDISRRLFKRLRECENAKNGRLRVWDYGWDWRLSPHLLSQKLIAFLETLPSNQQSCDPLERGATVIAHSLGGLITRHAVNQRPDLFAGVVYAGTPQRCINILGPIRNGDAVLLNEKVLTAQVNFSLRTTFVFLPEDGFCFVNKNTGEQFPVDFYNPEEWARQALSPCIEPWLPAYNVRQSALGSLLNLSGSLPNLPARTRGNSSTSDRERAVKSPTKAGFTDAGRQAEVQNDRSLAPQMGTLQSDSSAAQQGQHDGPETLSERDRNMAYLERTLANTKKFRAELHHQPHLTESNQYPPLAVMYGKDTPTVYAAHVTNREAIPCADAYDNLLFQSGDGVVLAREAMLPPGYALVKGGRISTDRGHITMLGDLQAVGRALEAVIRGRRKGIGLGGLESES